MNAMRETRMTVPDSWRTGQFREVDAGPNGLTGQDGMGSVDAVEYSFNE